MLANVLICEYVQASREAVRIMLLGGLAAFPWLRQSLCKGCPPRPLWYAAWYTSSAGMAHPWTVAPVGITGAILLLYDPACHGRRLPLCDPRPYRHDFPIMFFGHHSAPASGPPCFGLSNSGVSRLRVFLFSIISPHLSSACIHCDRVWSMIALATHGVGWSLAVVHPQCRYVLRVYKRT